MYVLAGRQASKQALKTNISVTRVFISMILFQLLGTSEVVDLCSNVSLPFNNKIRKTNIHE